MFCPQCGTGLGEGARGCAACGWSNSRKTLWIVLGSIAGLLLLVCCGVGTWLFVKAKRFGEAMQASYTPSLVLVARVQVLEWAAANGGKLPATLAEAAGKPLEGVGGEQFGVHHGDGTDLWGGALRYTPSPDGSYEVRSAGADRQFDTADDVAEKGKATDDLAAVKKEAAARLEKAFEDLMRTLGVDAEAIRKAHGERPPAPPPPPK